jgi:hypothetical protein
LGNFGILKWEIFINPRLAAVIFTQASLMADRRAKNHNLINQNKKPLPGAWGKDGI